MLYAKIIPIRFLYPKILGHICLIYLYCSFWIDRQSVASLLDDDNYTPPTPPHTTITPNDNDGGIYLSWTQHMLRQQGFRPSSYNPNEVSESDSDSTNSSLTDDEDSLTITPPHLPTSRSVPSREAICNIDIKKDENDKGWLAVAFCGFCFLWEIHSFYQLDEDTGKVYCTKTNRLFLFYFGSLLLLIARPLHIP